jgi:integrase
MTGTMTPPRCWKLEEWPDGDRAAWMAGTAPGGSLLARRYAGELRPASIDKARRGYGRWLEFLHRQGWLDPALAPLDRVTPDRLGAYFCALRDAGNADFTIIGRFAELQRAIRIMTEHNARWIRRPYGTTVYASLPRLQRPIMVPDSGLLYHWGVTLITGADLSQPGIGALCAYRDGVIIALLATRARRLHAMAGLELHHLVDLHEESCWIELPPELVKTRKRDRFPIPQALLPALRRYVAVVRPRLLRGHRESALWISYRGTQLTAKGLSGMIFQRSRKRFGTGFRPHRFRHAVSTTSAVRLSEYRGLAAGLLGISASTVEQSYSRPGQAHAALQFDAILDQREAEPDHED